MSLTRRLALVQGPDEIKFMETALKIAFATTDMETVNQHFGSAKSFAVYAVDMEDSQLLEAAQFGELNQDGNELDQFGSHGDQQFLPAGDLAGCPDQPGEGDGDANDRPVQKSYAEHFQHQPKQRHIAQPDRTREHYAKSPNQ